jgi:hypothetical protein
VLRPATLVGGLYASLATLLLGQTVVDVLAAAGALGSDRAAQPGTADRLLLLTGLAILAGLAASAASAASAARGRAPAWFGASVVLLLLGLFVPPLLAGPIGELEQASGHALGPWIRVAIMLLATVLAWAGLWTTRRPTRGRSSDRRGR